MALGHSSDKAAIVRDDSEAYLPRLKVPRKLHGTSRNPALLTVLFFSDKSDDGNPRDVGKPRGTYPEMEWANLVSVIVGNSTSS